MCRQTNEVCEGRLGGLLENSAIEKKELSYHKMMISWYMVEFYVMHI